MTASTRSLFNRTASASIIASTLTAVSVPTTAQEMEITANIGVVSNYIVRGATASNSDAAVQGGLDLTVDGFYAGTWASNLGGGGSEVDFYLGYDFELPIEGATIGANAIYYVYPEAADTSYVDIGLFFGYEFFSAGIQYTPYSGNGNEYLYVDGDFYYSVGLSFPLPNDFGFDLRGGYYDFKNKAPNPNDPTELVTADRYNYGASIIKDTGDFGTFSFNVDAIGDPRKYYTGVNRDPQVWVGWSKTF
ncbi:TorF family putative porin [uncultured Thiohalocapsa sp.]|uniref:TorF family putative porin n=1 Tax=uncultured Thiohalocapsa sp. TaxID=768990 RepID=UPI0025EEE3EA|nr:TorF family putative porin [uncultured Thiohalocapsa sp.]